MRTIAVRNWDKFQHYKTRHAPWIKLYRDLLTGESWVLGTDLSRVVQIASILLAVRYGNAIPYNYKLLKQIMALDCTERELDAAIVHLKGTEFVDVVGDEIPKKRPASKTLATCKMREEESRGEESRVEEMVPTEPVALVRDEPVDRVFRHWQTVHQHDRAGLDKKRRQLIHERLKTYSEADLCQAISGYKNSPHHMGQNKTGTVYDSLELLLRDSEHIDMGLKFYSAPPRTDLSEKTRQIVSATEEWQPPEVRRAVI